MDLIAPRHQTLGEHGSVPVGLVMLLIPTSRYGYKASVSQPSELAMHSAGAAVGELDELSALKAAIRLRKEQRENALLDRREKRIRQTAPRDLVIMGLVCERPVHLVDLATLKGFGAAWPVGPEDSSMRPERSGFG